MKKFLLIVINLFCSIALINAQTLYGNTFGGGTNGGGTLNAFTTSTNDLTVLKSFDNFAAYPRFSKFVQANDGKLYNMAETGGAYGQGVIFSYDPLTAAYTILKSFTGADGSQPMGGLLVANDGKLYGMTSQGGIHNIGVIFSFDPVTHTYTKLRDFESFGTVVFGSLIQATNGNIYGMTQGGATTYGVIFSIDPVINSYNEVVHFDGTNGASPQGTLFQASDGKLYGLTTSGGAAGLGVMFSYDPSASVYKKIKDLDDSTGRSPTGSLIQASNGKLYGMTSDGGSSFLGSIFSFDLSSSTFSKLKDLDDSSGGRPFGELLQATDGKLYGLTGLDAKYGDGCIFSFDTASFAYTKLKEFNFPNGSGPVGSLMQASDGKLYATANGDSINSTGNGIIFSYDIISGNYTHLRDLGVTESGSNPVGALVPAKDGKLYGLTLNGGSKGFGSIYFFNPLTAEFKSVYGFDYVNGANPYGSLIQADDGKLYGTTQYGGSDGNGTIFSFDPVSDSVISLHSCLYSTGSQPIGSLLQAKDGKLYGTMQFGGANEQGTLFSFDLHASVYSDVVDFGNLIGGTPLGSLILGDDQQLYGMTYEGAGDIFSFNPVTSRVTTLHIFNSTDGANPFGNLIQASNKKLYGMTTYGGSNADGVIFSFDLSTSTYSKLQDFDYSNGAYPYGSLLQAGNGKLYGTTEVGGSDGVGVVFSYDIPTATYSQLQDFDTTNGANPFWGSAFIEIPEGGTLPITLLNFSGKNNGSSNQLSWKVANLQQFHYYQLERSPDGQNFTPVSIINNNGNMRYNYTDNSNALVSPVYYYRLKLVDIDGRFKYSAILKLSRDVNFNFVTVNPNPFRDNLVITLSSLNENQASFSITDASGKQIYKGVRQLYKGINMVSISETRQLSKGNYLLTITTSQQSQTIKIVKGN